MADQSKWEAMASALGGAASGAGNWLFGTGGGGGGGGYPNPALPNPAPGPNMPPVPADPSQPIGAVTDGGGGSFNPKNALGLVSVIGQVMEQIQRQNTASNLRDPNYIAKQVGKLEAANAPQLMAALGPGIEASQAEKGLSTAPGLMAAAEFQGIGPELMRQAIAEYFSGLSEADQQEQPTAGIANVANLIQQLYGSGNTTP